jgi:hypothetical protein
MTTLSIEANIIGRRGFNINNQNKAFQLIFVPYTALIWSSTPDRVFTLNMDNQQIVCTVDKLSLEQLKILADAVAENPHITSLSAYGDYISTKALCAIGELVARDHNIKTLKLDSPCFFNALGTPNFKKQEKLRHYVRKSAIEHMSPNHGSGTILNHNKRTKFFEQTKLLLRGKRATWRLATDYLSSIVLLATLLSTSASLGVLAKNLSCD